MRKHIIAIGGGGFGRSIGSLKIERYILNLSKKKRPRICFIPTATGDSDSYKLNFYKAFSRIDCRPSHIDLFKRTINLKKHIEKQDVEITSFNKMLESEQFQEVAIIDSTSTSMYDNLVKLEKKSKEFDEIDFEGLKKEFKESMDEYDKDVKELGRIEAILDTSKDDIENLTPIVEELNLAKK